MLFKYIAKTKQNKTTHTQISRFHGHSFWGTVVDSALYQTSENKDYLGADDLQTAL